MKKKIRISEAKMNRIIAEAAKKVLKEGLTSTDPNLGAWEFLEETIGAEQILNCIYQYADSKELDEYIDCFRQEGYLDGYDAMQNGGEDEDY